jgi:hypothetical protein
VLLKYFLHRAQLLTQTLPKRLCCTYDEIIVTKHLRSSPLIS